MENKKKYYKENIKDRMFKNAANFWGVRNVENLDPLVKLLIEALASEIYKLSNEVNNIETRILERIAHLLTPDILMSARPAHMLLHAQPLEVTGIFNKETGFYYDDPVFKQKNKISDVSFYPVDSFTVRKSSIKALVCGKSIYTLDETLNKEILTRSTVRSEKFSQSVWVGLQLDPAVDTIKDMSFYFDFVNIENKIGYFHLLPFTQWKHQSKTIKVSPGIHTIKETEDEEGDMSLFASYDLANISDDSIRRFYNHRFVTLKDGMKTADMKQELFPEELKSMFSEETIQRMQEPLYWFHIVFPPSFDEDIIDRVIVATNVFPIANKSLRSQNSRNLKLANIIPLITDHKESFLSVHSVTDSLNRHYKQLPFRDNETQQYGTYSIKRGGTERFDSRDAKEYVSHLVDLLRDEGAAFALIGRGFLGDMIDGVEKLITALGQKIIEIDHKMEIPSYLIIDSETKDEIIYVDYWITNSEMVNNIKAGTSLATYNETFANSNSVLTMTPCTGGKERPRPGNVLDMYKFILSSRDRIYTSEDIINFCHSEFGEIIATAEVKKGVQVSSKPKEGLVRTIDVFIELKKHFNFASSEELKGNLHNSLIEKSPDTYNYRIFINK